MIHEDAYMRNRVLCLLAASAVVAALALPAAAVAATAAKHAAGVNRGVVQSVDATHIVLRALDGSAVSFDLTPGTGVRLNGSPASVGDISPGSVVDVVVNGKGRVLVIRVLGAPIVTDRGVVTAVTKASVTINTSAGIRTIAFDGNTRFRVFGASARRNAVRPGAQVTVTHTVDGPAQVVNVIKRPGA
jgi:hypothetical protein